MDKIKIQIDSCIRQKDWLGVALLYEKVSYITDSDSISVTAKIISADFYKKSHQYSEAIYLLKSINVANQNDSVKYTIKYQSALNYYLMNELDFAKSEILNLYYLVKDTTLHYKAYPLSALIFNELYEWPEAKKLLLKYNSFLFRNNLHNLDTYQDSINILYNPQSLPQLKKTKKAILLSTFIPGLGQVYSKNYLEGTLSFISCSSIILLTLTGIYYQYYFTSIISGSSLWAKFYTGNISRAEFLSNQYNYLISKEYNRKLKEFIVNKYLK